MHESIKRKLTSMVYEKIITDVETKDFCILPNGHLLIPCNNNLSLYDKDYSLIKRLTSINGRFLSTCFVTTNGEDKVYFSNFEPNQIVMTDLDLNFLNSVGSSGTEPHMFRNPQGIFFHNNCLYVSDADNRRVKKLSSSLENLSLYNIDIKPRNIKITNSMACIRENLADFASIYFYSVEDFTLKFKYGNADQRFGCLTTFNSTFFVFDFKIKKFYCYDHIGNLLEEILCPQFSEYNNDDDGNLAYIHGDLLFASAASNTVFKM